MAQINLAGSTVTYSFGSIIALVVLILAIVALVGGIPTSATILLWFIIGLALARLT